METYTFISLHMNLTTPYVYTCFPSCLQAGHPNFPLNCIIFVNEAFAGRSASVNKSRALTTTSFPLRGTLIPVR